MRTKNLVALLGAVLVLASCTERAPLTSTVESSPPQALSLTSTSSGLLSTVNLLSQSATAPPLQTYQLDFWAVEGRVTTARIDYQPDLLGKVSHFLALTIPAQSQLVLPDGTPLAAGDSVLISLTVDPVLFKVRFEPHGLRFEVAPAALVFHYGLANLDLDGNGVINWVDQTLEAQLQLVYQADDAAPWSQVREQAKSVELNLIGAPLRHFSNYAVSW
jgi:hypothetical protein